MSYTRSTLIRAANAMNAGVSDAGLVELVRQCRKAQDVAAARKERLRSCVNRGRKGNAGIGVMDHKWPAAGEAMAMEFKAHFRAMEEGQLQHLLRVAEDEQEIEEYMDATLCGNWD